MDGVVTGGSVSVGPTITGRPAGKTSAGSAKAGASGVSVDPLSIYKARWDQLFAQARSSPTFRNQLLNTPETAMTALGLSPPNGAKVTFHEWDAKDLHIYLEPAGAPFVEVALSFAGASLESGLRLLKERRPTPYVTAGQQARPGRQPFGQSQATAATSLVAQGREVERWKQA